MKHIKIDIKNNNKFIPRDFLVDTGAGISIIKESCLDEKTIYNKNDKITINGINQGSISESIGSIHLNLEFAHHKVYIMKDDEIDTTYDGIIGADFFEINQAKICYKINKLIINETIKIDLLNNNKDNEDDEILNNYIVKPRTETITKVEITNPEIIKSEIIDDELNQEGVYLVNANENNETLCTTLNTTDQQLRIDNLKVELKPISISTEINNFENENVTKNIPEYCNTRNVKGKIDLWQKLTNNRWLYTLSESKKLTINCKNKKNEYVELFQTGIIKLDKGCKTNNGLISLNADNNIFTEYENPMSNINIINDKCCVIGKTNYSLHQLDPIKLINVDNTNTQKVLETFEKFNEKLENYQNQPAIVKHSSFFVKLIYGIIITIVILMLVKISFHLYKCFRDKKRFNVKYIRKTRDNVENEVEIVQIEPEIRSREEILNAISG
ncbi:uncharacterized protein LOC143910732 [Arctopsyche grandis]|uniref:uncharacterized protein LOC143910732 n=1 Tax=Arctopsyche grandis TaxID=121162 RepID=UPI00406D7308